MNNNNGMVVKVVITSVLVLGLMVTGLVVTRDGWDISEETKEEPEVSEVLEATSFENSGDLESISFTDFAEVFNTNILRLKEYSKKDFVLTDVTLISIDNDYIFFHEGSAYDERGFAYYTDKGIKSNKLKEKLLDYKTKDTVDILVTFDMDNSGPHIIFDIHDVRGTSSIFSKNIEKAITFSDKAAEDLFSYRAYQLYKKYDANELRLEQDADKVFILENFEVESISKDTIKLDNKTYSEVGYVFAEFFGDEENKSRLKEKLVNYNEGDDVEIICSLKSNKIDFYTELYLHDIRLVN